MPEVAPAVLLVGVTVASAVAVAATRQYAISRGILDHPQERSSHDLPTPRGGGIGLITAALLGFTVGAPGASDMPLLIALVGLVPTGLVGWLDDRSSLPPSPRIAAHLLSGALIVPLALGGWPTTPVEVLAAAAWVVAAVSAINVINFMDGIDGIIGLQAAVFGLHLYVLAGPESQGGVLALSMMAAALGFLVWNWAPARIFLGDVGSGALALLALIAAVLVWRGGTWPFLAVFLPLFPLFLDSAVTILSRARRGERLTVPHRDHLYQRLARDAGWGHAPVTLLYGAAATVGMIVVHVAPEPTLVPTATGYVVVSALAGLWLSRAAAGRSRQRL